MAQAFEETRTTLKPGFAGGTADRPDPTMPDDLAGLARMDATCYGVLSNMGFGSGWLVFLRVPGGEPGCWRWHEVLPMRGANLPVPDC